MTPEIYLVLGTVYLLIAGTFHHLTKWRYFATEEQLDHLRGAFERSPLFMGSFMLLLITVDGATWPVGSLLCANRVIKYIASR